MPPQTEPALAHQQEKERTNREPSCLIRNSDKDIYRNKVFLVSIGG